MEYAVESIDLSKAYGSNVALDGLNLKVREGEIIVLLGPNGSGKTTFLQLISTVLKPSGGTAIVMGHDIVGEPLKVRQVATISFQDPRGFWRHKPSHILSFHASMYGVPGQNRRELVERTLKEFDLWDSREKKFMHLSGGQAKRLEVAKLFVHRPRLAIFDEPTTMVDLDGKRTIWDKIKQLREEGSTVIVATNEVREAEYLADRITIFAKGREVVTDSLSNLKDSVRGGDVVDIEFAQPVTRAMVDELSSVRGTAKVSLVAEGRLRVQVNRSEDWLPEVTRRVYSMGVKLSSIKVTEPSLDDVFMQYTGGGGP
ncbi:MAG: ATP-binding cassette domain-containing protein [Nitrososphaerota archaeon]|nr:ATP-binding cassette domain-containing protein [Nitrososphaerota archaeon]